MRLRAHSLRGLSSPRAHESLHLLDQAPHVKELQEHLLLLRRRRGPRGFGPLAVYERDEVGSSVLLPLVLRCIHHRLLWVQTVHPLQDISQVCSDRRRRVR